MAIHLVEDPLQAVTSALGREMPNDDRAERAILGSIIINNGALDRVRGIVDARDFFKPAHSTTFSEMCRLADRHQKIDLIELKSSLEKRGKLDEAGGTVYVSSLVDGIPDIANVEGYARIVALKSDARSMTRAFAQAAESAADQTPIAEITAELNPILNACLQRESAINRESAAYSLTSLPDFLSEPAPDIEWLVSDLLLKGGLGQAIAKPKVGKSTLARDLAFAVAGGTPFLGRKVQRGRVVFLALEEHRDRLRDQFHRMGFAGDEEIFIYTGPAPENGVSWLRALVAEYKPALVVIDPLLKFVRVNDANAYAEVSNALEPLTAIARESGAALLVTHHANKMAGEGGDSILGSSAIYASADTVVILRRRDDQTRTVMTIQRYGDDMPETVIAMDPESGLLAVAGDFQDMKIEAVIARISESLKRGQPMTEEEIREAVGGDRTLVARALRQGVEVRAIRRSGKGKKGSPYMYAPEGQMLAS